MYPDASKNGLNILSESDIARLRSEFAGQVIPPGDPAYDAGRVLFYGGFENRRPAVIIRAASDQDVARAVSLARETGLPLAVRSGGHSPAGLSLIDGGILLDLKGLNNLHIDPEGRTAWAESGLTTGEYTSAAAEYGLATGFGDTGTVGIGGLTLGGGVGYLVRKYGLTIDNLLAADLVTADGQLLRVDPGTTGPVLGVRGAATSAWSPASSSACRRCPPCWAACWCCRRRRKPSRGSSTRPVPPPRSCPPSPT